VSTNVPERLVFVGGELDGHICEFGCNSPGVHRVKYITSTIAFYNGSLYRIRFPEFGQQDIICTHDPDLEFEYLLNVASKG